MHKICADCLLQNFHREAAAGKKIFCLPPYAKNFRDAKKNNFRNLSGRKNKNRTISGAVGK